MAATHTQAPVTTPLTDLSFLNREAEWPPPSQEPRLTRYADNTLLWNNDHNSVYGDWWKVLRQDQEASIELIFGWHKRLTMLWADLLVSEPPRFFATNEEDDQLDPALQKHLDRITGKDDNAYVSTLQQTAVDISRYGDAIQKITLEEEGAAIWTQPPSYWFPVVDPTNIQKFLYHVLAFEMNPTPKERYLWVEIHSKGQIEYRAHVLKGEYIGDEIPPSFFKPEITTNIVPTGVKDFLIVPFCQLRTSESVFGPDDYSDINSIIQAIELRAAHINLILDKHADPHMYGDPSLLTYNKTTKKYEFKGGGQFFPVDAGGADERPVIPGYVTWEGQLTNAFEELNFLLDQLYVISETSPAAFGQQKEGLAESGSALRRLMMAPLAKVARIAMRFDPAARRALRLASALENANGRGTPILTNIQAQWQDGLPGDPKEQAETEQIRSGNIPTSSQVSSVRRLDGGTLEEAQAEVDRINEEAEQKAKAALEQAQALAETQPDPAPPGDKKADAAPSSGGKQDPPNSKEK